MLGLKMKRPHINKDQIGAVTLPITILLVLIMSLIAVTITEVSNTGATKTLDNQLSTQANYVAESGVNDALHFLETAPAGTSLPANPTDCNSFTDTYLPGKNVLSQSPYVAYTCLIVTAQPSSLVFNIQQGQAQQVRIDPQPAGTGSSINISWQKSGSSDDISNCSQASLQFVSQADWSCPFSVLRMDYYQQPNSTPSINSSDLEANTNTNTFFFFPVAGTPPTIQHVQFADNGQPTLVPVKCTDAGGCQVTLEAPAGSNFNGYASLNSVYSSAPNTTISGAGGAGLTFANSQLSIDSTGDDQGVLKRIHATVLLSPSSTPGKGPSNALEVGSALCKQYSVGPESANPSYIDNAFPGLTQNANSDNIAPLCGVAYKPAIYLYPTTAEDVNVKLSYPSGFAVTTPTYNPATGWNVLANPNGNLVNLSDGKNYPYLYWEGNETDFNFDMSKGFVVPGNQTASFLNEELPKIGLNKKETSAFLQYWVPRMEHNQYSLIHFAGTGYTNLAKLQITPKPDSLLRVFMAEEPLSHPVTVTPQTFPTFHRNGFTAVEWGGTILGQ
jgi:hypothetical protein